MRLYLNKVELKAFRMTLSLRVITSHSAERNLLNMRGPSMLSVCYLHCDENE